MITRELFTEIIEEIQHQDTIINTIIETLHIDIIETPLVQSIWLLNDYLIKSHFDEDGQDWINWWLYEKRGDPNMKAWDENEIEIPTETIEDLWNLIKPHIIK